VGATGVQLASARILAGSAGAGSTSPNLQQYRTGQPEPRVFTVPPQIQAGAFANPDVYLPKLVAYLLGGSNDPFLQVKALHDWVAVNIVYDVDSFFSGQISSQDASQTLKTHKAVCSGYSGLLKQLLDLAGFDNRIITGYGRGWGSTSLGTEHISSNHAWTAVRIRGAWYLLDSTWDAGYVSDSREFVRAYTDDYLYLEPADFLYTHFPDNPADELLATPLSRQQFLELPDLTGLFWTMGLRPLSPLQRVAQVGAEAVIPLQVPAGVQVEADLLDAKGVAQAQRSLVNFFPGREEVHVSFPAAGDWQVQIFAAPAGQQEFTSVGSLGFRAGEASKALYPTLYEGWYTHECALVDPLSTPIAGRTTQFELRVPGALQVFLTGATEGGPVYLTQASHDPALFRGTYVLRPGGQITVYAVFANQGDEAEGLLQYA